MITRNDYNLGLMNGDIGMTLTDADHKLRVAFPGEAGSIRWVSPLRLPDVETAFAMTVHKSQGSEFQHVVLVLPEVRSPVLTRELIYTGITRAREYFSLLETRPMVFAQAIENRRK
jgi:exodeoxyribonuclease V alpha subunit